MATIHQQKLGQSSTLAPGTTQTFRWNNAPWNTVLDFWAVPVPPSASGPHGSSSGQVQILAVRATYIRDNYGGDRRYVEIDVKNTGGGPTKFDMWMSWVG